MTLLKDCKQIDKNKLVIVQQTGFKPTNLLRAWIHAVKY